MLTSFHFGPAAGLRNRCFIVQTEHTKLRGKKEKKTNRIIIIKKNNTKPNPKSNKTQLICVCGEVSRSFLSPEMRGDRAAAPGKTQASRKARLYTPS